MQEKEDEDEEVIQNLRADRFLDESCSGDLTCSLVVGTVAGNTGVSQGGKCPNASCGQGSQVERVKAISSSGTVRNLTQS